VRKNIGINICDKLGRSPVYILCENLGKANNKSLTLLSMLMRSHQAGKLNMAPGYKGTTPLHLASKHDSQMMCNLLLCACKKLINSMDSLGRTPLHLATSADMVKFLVRLGADVYKKDYLGQTPLSYSCQRGNREVAATLLGMQQDVSKSKDSMGRTILHHCTISNSLQELEGVSELLINSTDIHQLSPLHYACLSGDEDRIQRLLDMGADPNLEDKNKLSPLHLASTSQSYNLLVQNKADTTLASRLGCSPADMQQWYAERRGKEPGKLSSAIKEEGRTAIAKIMNMPLLGFMERNEQYHTEFQQLVQILQQFMTKLNEEMTTIDPFFKSEVVLHGSPQDGTVVGTRDELNFVFVLTKVTDILETPSKCVYSSAHTLLNLPSDFCGNRPDFVDADGSVIVPVLCHAFHSAVQRAFGSPNVWSDFWQLYSDPNHNPTSKHTAPTNPNIAKGNQDGPADTLHLMFHGKVFKWLPVTVRIVPAIRFDNWWPSWLPQRRIPDRSVSYLLVQESPNMPPQKQPYLFLVDCRDAEDRLIRDLPSPALKNGYRLAKLMRQPEICAPLKTTDGECRDTDSAMCYISEEMLKTVVLVLSEEEADRATKMVGEQALVVSEEGAKISECSTKPPEKTFDSDIKASRKYARLIYERLATALHTTSLMSYFVPTHDIFKAHFQHLNESVLNSRKVAKAYCEAIQTLLAE
jgi:ankyrin repeat protein